MANRSGGYSFSWFVIGFLAGVAATLAVLIFTGRSMRREEAIEPAPVQAAAHAAPRAQLKPRPPNEALPSSAPTTDEQVAEDAAAAGMTSRSKSRPGQ